MLPGRLAVDVHLERLAAAREGGAAHVAGIRFQPARFEEIEAELEALSELRDKPAGSIRITARENATTTVLLRPGDRARTNPIGWLDIQLPGDDGFVVARLLRELTTTARSLRTLSMISLCR